MIHTPYAYFVTQTQLHIVSGPGLTALQLRNGLAGRLRFRHRQRRYLYSHRTLMQLKRLFMPRPMKRGVETCLPPPAVSFISFGPVLTDNHLYRLLVSHWSVDEDHLWRGS